MTTLCTAEAVAEGQPDKLCDRIADAVLDAALRQDPDTRSSCEVAICGSTVHLMGILKTTAAINWDALVRSVIASAGYTDPAHGFCAQNCMVQNELQPPSPDLLRTEPRHSTPDRSAASQHTVVGFACRETPDFMPLPVELARSVIHHLALVRKNGVLPFLLPDGKAQITLEYEGDVPKRIASLLLCAQHTEQTEIEPLRSILMKKVIHAAIPSSLLDDSSTVFINPTGRFVTGGPAAATGMTGRKIACDTYGSASSQWDGSFSGKDASHPEKFAAYLARYLAKNTVAAGFARKCEFQLSYAVGLADPVAVAIRTFGTETIHVQQILQLAQECIDFRPAAVLERFCLCRPIYSALCAGQFGKNARRMPWEQTDLAALWRSRVNLCTAAG